MKGKQAGDDNKKTVPVLTIGLATKLTGSGVTTAEEYETVYRLGAVADSYYAVVADADTTVVTSSNGNFLKAGAVEYQRVPKGHKIRVDTSADLTVGEVIED